MTSNEIDSKWIVLLYSFPLHLILASSAMHFVVNWIEIPSIFIIHFDLLRTILYVESHNDAIMWR